MDHKTPPTYIIKNFQEPHENFAAHKVSLIRSIGEGNLRKVSLFPNIFFLPRENLSRYLRKLNPAWCFAKTKRFDFKNYARNHSYSSSLREDKRLLCGNQIVPLRRREFHSVSCRLINP